VLAFLSSFGPWGVFNVSRYSQQARLKGYLEKYGLLKDGKVTDLRPAIPVEDRREISDITAYIVETHGHQPLQPWFPQNLDSMMRKDSLTGRYSADQRAQDILSLVHVSYDNGYGEHVNGYNRDVVKNFNCSMMPDDVVLSTEGLPYMVSRFELTAISRDGFNYVGYKLGKDSLIICLDSTVNELRLLSSASREEPASAGGNAIHVGLAPVLQRLPRFVNYGLKLSPEEMTLPFGGPGWKGRLFVRELSGIKSDGVLHVTRLTGDILIGEAGGGQ